MPVSFAIFNARRGRPVRLAIANCLPYESKFDLHVQADPYRLLRGFLLSTDSSSEHEHTFVLAPFTANRLSANWCPSFFEGAHHGNLVIDNSR